MRRWAARTAPRTKGRSSEAKNSRMSGAFCPIRAPLAAESAIATFQRTFSSGSCIHLRRRASVASGYERTNRSPTANGPRLLRTYSSWSRSGGSTRSRSGSAHSAVRVRAAYFAATTTARRRRLSGPLTHSRRSGIVSYHASVSTSPRRLAAVSRTAQSLSRARRYPIRVSSRKCVPASGHTISAASSLSTRRGCAIRRSAQSSRTRGAGPTASITFTALSYWSFRTQPFRPDLRSVSDAPSGSPACSERSKRGSHWVEVDVVSVAVTLVRQSARSVRTPLRSSRGSSRNTRGRGRARVRRREPGEVNRALTHAGQLDDRTGLHSVDEAVVDLVGVDQ